MFEGSATTMLSSLDTVGCLSDDTLLWPGRSTIVQPVYPSLVYVFVLRKVFVLDSLVISLQQISIFSPFFILAA